MASAKAPAISAVLIPSQTQPAAPTQASASPSRQAPASDPTRTSIQPRTSPSLAPQAQLPKPPRLPDTSPTPQAQLPTPPRLPDTSPTPLAQLPTPPRLPTTPASQPSRQLLFPSPPVHSWDDVALLIHEEMRRRHYSVHTLKCYQGWIRRFASFLGQRSPSSLSDQDARSFLSHLAVQSQVSAKTQNQALHAVVFLFRQLLGRPIDNLKGVERASEKRRLPQVLDRDKVRLLLERIHGLPGLMARLCYGCGLRLEECLSLRVKDIDFDRRQLTVRHGKGDKDRVVPLPRVVMEPLLRQITTAAELHQRDLAAGLGAVELPGALDRKLPGAARERAWQWIFPGRRVIVYPDGVARRPHLHPSVLQRALTRAVRELQLDSRVTVHTLRHCFATHLLEDGVNIRRLQELLGHSSVQTTMIYTHVRVQPLESAAFSPLDRL